MDVLVVSAIGNSRADAFQAFVQSKGVRAIRLDIGARLPMGELMLSGAVVFDSGSIDLGGALSALREPTRYFSIPLVGVTAEEKPLRLTALRGAGADLLCAPDTPDALILKEINARCQARPIDDAMREQLAAPLITAVQQALAEMASVEVLPCAVYRRETPAVLGDLTVVLSFTSELQGGLILSFNKKTAESLAARILAPMIEANHALISDCMGEIGNVVAGQAKTMLAGTPYHFTFGTPTVGTAFAIPIPFEASCLVIALTCDAGPFALQMSARRE